MQESRPSRTAYRVAQRRAAHQVLDDPKVFDDPLAAAIVGPDQDGSLRQSAAPRALRAFIAVRSRYAEDELREAVARGVNQYVVLGAGLDTFAYRNAYAASGLQVFEVDHPATQAWKRERLTEAGIAIPENAHFVPVDFERQELGECLRAAGLKSDGMTFFSWLGVAPYLTSEAFWATLRLVSGMPKRSGIVFDFAVARSALNLKERMAMAILAARVAAAGEPFQLFFEPAVLEDELRRRGFSKVERLGPAEINSRYFHERADGLCITGGLAHLISAVV